SMAGLRRQATTAETAAAATGFFARRFGLSPEELIQLYGNHHWKDAAIGGNRWAVIAQSVIRLGDALDRGNAPVALDLLDRRIPAMCHNTGQVGEKLRHLQALSE
ncbi:MAG TPA: hypothetical protein VFD97_06680, partial [Acidimicrobiia bacterium]|nr:hypothetical protein [Acidimicrobiia bacterium]